MKKPNLLLDFDGTLSGYKKGWQGPSVLPEAPVEGAKEALNTLKKHFNIVLFSVRANTETGKKAIEKYMKDNDLYYDAITTEKIEGLILDDNAIQFKGSWKQSLKDIANFKNWLLD